MSVDAFAERFPAIRSRDFRFLWGGTASTSIALWTMLLGNAWIVFHLSGSSAWVGVSTFASMSPYFLAPFGGVVADRFERRRLVRSTRIGALLVTTTLFTLAVTDHISVGSVVALALAQGLIRAIEIPSDQALLANVVPAHALPSAVTLSTMSQHGSRAVGPILAAPMLNSVGVEGAYLISAFFAFLAFTSLRGLQTTSRGTVASVADVAGSLRTGLSYIFSSRPVLAVFGIVVAHCVLTMSFDAMLPGFAEHDLHAASTGFTTMTMGVGIGALVGTFSLGFIPGGRGRAFLITGVASGLAPVAMALSTRLATATVSAVLMGSSQVMFMALSAIFIQSAVPDGIRGRVMSFYLMSAGGLMAVANLGFGAFADALGAPVLFVVPGLAFTVIIAGTTVTSGHLRRLYSNGELRVTPAPATA